MDFNTIAMEQQTISIAKSGVVCSLAARTAIMAAANPVGGHYNKSKTVTENLKMNPALLSRFDLVFILIDKPDESVGMYEYIWDFNSITQFSSFTKKFKNIVFIFRLEFRLHTIKYECKKTNYSVLIILILL